MTTSDAPDTPGNGAASVESSRFKAAARQFATGVTVAAVASDDGVHLITATAFFPLSLDPPLILIALDKAGRLLGLMRASGHIGVSVLGAHHQHLSEWAALHGRDPGAVIPDVEMMTAITGAPLVRDAAAWFDCVLEREHDHGDHSLVIGRVVDVQADPSVAPLLYMRGTYHDLGNSRPRTTG